MPTLHEMLESYKRSLMAHVQLEEFRSWGSPLTEGFRGEIAAHVQLERVFIGEMIEQRARASLPRERGDLTVHGLPPATAWPKLPDVLPWDCGIAELAGLSIEVKCSCSRTTHVPLRLLAGNHGWTKTLREIVPKLRCSKPGCRRVPATVLLMSESTGQRSRPDSKVTWFQLVPAGDEAMFPHRAPGLDQ